MPRVKNLETRHEHDVPEGHFSLSSSKYETITATPPELDAWEVTPSGGGWYEISKAGEKVDKVRGEDAASERLAELKKE